MILGILLGENYFDTRVLANIVSVCLHRCQQSLQVHPSKGTEVRATSLDFGIHLQRLASEVVNTCSCRWAISRTPMKIRKEPKHEGGFGGSSYKFIDTGRGSNLHKKETCDPLSLPNHRSQWSRPSNVSQGSSSISKQSSESHIIFHCPSYQLTSFRDRNLNI
jgi:hypothetical protein